MDSRRGQPDRDQQADDIIYDPYPLLTTHCDQQAADLLPRTSYLLLFYSLLPTPYSLLPTPYSLHPTPYSRLPLSPTHRDEQADDRLEVAHAKALDGQEAQRVDRGDEAASPHWDVTGGEKVEGDAGADHLEG